MARYIDADAYAFPGDLINEPTADVVEVVRCKDCVHSRQPRHPKYAQPECVILNAIVKDDFYCAKGQPRTPKERGGEK